MTNTLKLSHTFKISALALTAMLALASAAQAEGVKISITGKSRDVVRSEVVQAARSVCEQAVSTDLRDLYGSLDECVSATVDATFAKIATGSGNLAMAAQSTRAR